ncbi:MAG: patatin-like phospholipase family protein [Acidobacteriaceae bacterium]|nr:patatin-like phospholipase family protein [Acidobacteriaceae bacterium]
MKQIHVEYEPQLEIGVVATDLLRLRPVVFTGAEVTWQHLAASTAIPGIFSQHRISNRVYSDGGLLDAVPIWAAAEMGAQYILAVNVLPELPNAAIRQAAKLLRKVMRFRPSLPESVVVHRITAPCLGSVRDALYWKRDNVVRWVEAGEKDAAEQVNQVRTLSQPEIPLDSDWSPARY